MVNWQNMQAVIANVVKVFNNIRLKCKSTSMLWCWPSEKNDIWQKCCSNSYQNWSLSITEESTKAGHANNPTVVVVIHSTLNTVHSVLLSTELTTLSWWHIGHFLAPVSGVSNRRQSSDARNHDTLYQQMILAEKNKDGFRFSEFWKWWYYSCCFSI